MNSNYSKGPKEFSKPSKLFKGYLCLSAVRVYLLLLFIFTLLPTVQSQKKNADYRLHIRKTNSPITIDGKIDEDAWQVTDVAKDFFMVLPEDTGKAEQFSEVRMCYDDKHIYLAATFYNNPPGPYYVESLRRDFSFGKNDNFLIILMDF